MPLPNTVVAQSKWVTAQNPNHWLTAEELIVFDAWRSEKRKAEWLAGRLAAKRLMLESFDLKPLNWQVGRAGAAPILIGSVIGFVLPDITLSLSHSEGTGAATFSQTHTEGSVGIDIQRIRPVHPGLCARVFTQDERQQLKVWFGSENDLAGMLLLWALKEAAIKARRQAWGRPLQNIEVTLSSPGFGVVSMEDDPPLTAQYERLGDWWVARVVRTYPATSRDPPETGR